MHVDLLRKLIYRSDLQELFFALFLQLLGLLSSRRSGSDLLFEPHLAILVSLGRTLIAVLRNDYLGGRFEFIHLARELGTVTYRNANLRSTVRHQVLRSGNLNVARADVHAVRLVLVLTARVGLNARF